MVDLMKIIRAMIKEEKKGSWEGAKKNDQRPTTRNSTQIS